MSKQALSFLGGVDRFTGKVVDPKSDLYHKKVSEKILFICCSVGSTVGAYVIYAICKSNLGPKAIICERADPMLVTGCAIAGIPLIDGIRPEILINSKMYAFVNGSDGTVKIFDREEDLY
ncbi:MAG: aconitase X swivel domain-containing protein [Nitrososphaeria archaeon]